MKKTKMVNVHHYQIRNGKKYDIVAIDETIRESELPAMQAKYRNLVGSVLSRDNKNRMLFNPDVFFQWREM